MKRKFPTIPFLILIIGIILLIEHYTKIDFPLFPIIVIIIAIAWLIKIYR